MFRRLVANIRARDRPVTVEPQDAVVVVSSEVGEIMTSPQDKVMGPFIKANGVWEPNEGDWLRTHVRPGATCANVGANIGYFSRLMADLSGANGIVYAFEPNPQVLPYLRLNAQARRGQAPIAVHPKAVGATCGRLDFFVNERNLGDSRCFDPRLTVGGGDYQTHGFESSLEPISVTVCTLDEVLSGVNLDVLLVDTQGFDHQVIRGAKALIERHPPRILTEFVPQWIEDQGESPAAVLEEFEDMGFHLSSPDFPGLTNPKAPDLLLAIHESDTWFANISLIPRGTSL
jgi:FkbM family methyltransferase